MKNFTNDEIEARISTKIPEHSDKNPIPQGDDPNHYLQAEELNIIVKFLDENTAIVKELMKNSNELGFSVENYIQLYNSDEEFQIFYDEGLSSKIYFNPATEVIRIGLLDSDGFKEYNFSEIQKIPQLKTALDNETVERARVDVLKMNKPTTNATSDYVLLADGSTAAKGDLGKNFANTDLVVSQNRKHTGTASVEFAMPFICSNASVRYSSLVSKHNDATFNRLLGMDASGNINEVGLSAMTNEMSKSTDAQIDAWRLANRKASEGHSVEVPRIDYILPDVYANDKNEITYVPCVGLNLLLNTKDCEVKVINTTTLQEYPVPVIQTITGNFSMFSFGINFYQMPIGTYKIYVRNGVFTNIDTTTFNLVEYITTEVLAVNFNTYFKDGLSAAYKNTFTTGVNYISKVKDMQALGNIPICDMVSTEPVIITQDKDFVFTCILTLNTSAAGYLGDFQLGLTQGFVDNIFNTVQYGVKFNGTILQGTLKSTNLIGELFNSNKVITVQVKRKGSMISVVASVDGVYSSEILSVNISNPLYFIFKDNSMTSDAYVTGNPIIINLLSLQYLN